MVVDHVCFRVVDFIQRAEYDMDIQPDTMETSLSNRHSLQNLWNAFNLRVNA